MSSILYTIGTALNRAEENDASVEVLVEGQWLFGRVAAVDGHGLVLRADDLEHSVVRLERVSAVRVFAEAPVRTPLTRGARPMGGPPASWAQGA
jgi:hypothetical protein